jgi:uncharacterized protein YjbI with pentapeptide repeats
LANWPECTVDGCSGAAVGTARKYCLQHVEASERSRLLETWVRKGEFDVRGVIVTAELWQQVQAGIRSVATERPTRIQLEEATIEDQVNLRDYSGRISIEASDANFLQGADFVDCNFELAQFTRARFKSDTHFAGAIFRDGAEFVHARFDGYADFLDAHFLTDANFREAECDWLRLRAHIRGHLILGGARLGDHSYLAGLQVDREAHFENTRWGDYCVFDGARIVSGGFPRATFGKAASFRNVHGELHFGRAEFGDYLQLGPLHTSRLDLSAVGLGGSSTIDVVGADLSASGLRAVIDCTGLQAPHGVTIRVAHADVILDRAVVSSPGTLRASSGPIPATDAAGSARLVSLRDADVSGLSVPNLNLELCVFDGAANLERMRLGGNNFFLSTPSGWIRWHGLPVWRWTRRRVLFEEAAWRVRHEGKVRRAGWHGEPYEPPGGWIPHFSPFRSDWPKEERLSRAREVAEQYRALRRGLEEGKNEPEAADFYYGEMEMRRLVAGGFQRYLLQLYWLCAGYALRALRSLATLAIILVLSALAFSAWGFRTNPQTVLRPTSFDIPDRRIIYSPQSLPAPPSGIWDGFTYSLQSATSLLRAPEERPLTRFGVLLQVVLRVVGPVLVALTALAVRSHVKR